MSNRQDTVELPADPQIKQLANDVVREENEYSIPILLDLYEFLSELDEGEPVKPFDMRIENPRSDLEFDQWEQFLDLLLQAEIVEPDGKSKSRVVIRDQ